MFFLAGFGMTMNKADSRNDAGSPRVSPSRIHQLPADAPGSPERRSLLRGLAALPLLAVLAHRAEAQDVELSKTFQTPEAFITEAFAPAAAPPPSMLLLDAGKHAQLSAALGHPYPQARLRYWKAAGRSAWIFDDIGKQGYVPTTCGFIVANASIEHARVLIYRESRGAQIGEVSFLRQLIGARAAGNGLDKHVDNISGATLSVNMMQRMARAALVFDSLTV